MNYKQALKLATEKHKGQLRKNSGKPYITHLIAVADKFTDEKHKIVAILHDIVEDTNMSIFHLADIFHTNDDLLFNSTIISSINQLTKKKEESYLNYISRVKKNKLAKEIKIEDLKHNLSDINKGNLKEKYIMALYILEEMD